RSPTRRHHPRAVHRDALRRPTRRERHFRRRAFLAPAILASRRRALTPRTSAAILTPWWGESATYTLWRRRLWISAWLRIAWSSSDRWASDTTLPPAPSPRADTGDGVITSVGASTPLSTRRSQARSHPTG